MEALDAGDGCTELERERGELLRAVSDSFGPGAAEAPFSESGPRLRLLAHIENQWAGPPATVI